MAEHQRIICRADELTDDGRAVRFTALIANPAREVACFVIGFDGQVYGYANSCPHRGIELDWQEGEVFEETGLYLMCATHGALFEPDSGLCVAGPCQGARLRPLAITVSGGDVVLDGHGVDLKKFEREP